jgi:hypothetical protein
MGHLLPMHRHHSLQKVRNSGPHPVTKTADRGSGIVIPRQDNRQNDGAMLGDPLCRQCSAFRHVHELD